MAVRYITVSAISNLFPRPRDRLETSRLLARHWLPLPARFKTPIAVTNPNSVSDPSNAAAGQAHRRSTWFQGALGASVKTVLAQTPGPTKVWAVRSNPGTQLRWLPRLPWSPS